MKKNFNLNIKNNKFDIKPFILVYIPALLLACLAYFFDPLVNGGYDLKEYYSWMDKMLIFKGTDLYFFLMYGGEIISMLYLYVIAKIGDYQLLQFFPTFIFYSAIFYMIYKYTKNNKISKKHIIIVLLVFLSLFKYIFIVSSFRYCLAYCIFALGIYFEFVEHRNEKRFKILYILPLFIHISTIMLLFLRILFCFKSKKRIFYLIFMVVILVCLFPNNFIKFLKIFEFIPLVSYLVNKIQFYLISEYVPLFLQYVFRILQAIIFLAFGIIVYRTNNNSKDNNYIIFYIMTCMFTITTIGYYSLFMRLIDFILFISIALLFKLLTQANNFQKKYKIGLYFIIFLLIVAGIRIQIPIFVDMYF